MQKVCFCVEFPTFQPSYQSTLSETLSTPFILPPASYLKVQQRPWRPESGWPGSMCWCWWQSLWIQPQSRSPPRRMSSRRRSVVGYHRLWLSRCHTPPQGSAWERCSSWSVPLGSWHWGSCLLWAMSANAFLEKENEMVKVGKDYFRILISS